MDSNNRFNVVIPAPEPIRPEDLLKETEIFLLKTRLEQEILKDIEFRQKMAEHKRQHPCCLHPEICVTPKHPLIF